MPGALCAGNRCVASYTLIVHRRAAETLALQLLGCRPKLFDVDDSDLSDLSDSPFTPSTPMHRFRPSRFLFATFLLGAALGLSGCALIDAFTSDDDDGTLDGPFPIPDAGPICLDDPLAPDCLVFTCEQPLDLGVVLPSFSGQFDTCGMGSGSPFPFCG